MLRNAYIASGLLHLLALALLFAVAQMPSSPLKTVRRYQPVRLVTPPGAPGPISRGQPRVTEPAEPKTETPSEEMKPEQVKPTPRQEPPSPGKAAPKEEPAAKPVPGEGAAKPEAPTRTGKAGAGSGGAGGSNLQLEGVNFPYPYYLSNIQIKILSNFKPAIGAREARELKAVVFFIIDRTGRIMDVKLEDKSGHFLFDQEAQRAVLRSNPLPALPPAFGSDRLGVHFEFVGSP